MEPIINAWKSMGVLGYIIPVLFVIYIIWMISYMNKRKKKQQGWWDAHPGAVKVYLRSSYGMLTSNSITGHVIRGEACPGIVSEGMNQVFYAMPGELEVELTYEYTRPGVLHKNVTQVWGPTKLSLQLEAGKTYSLTFDKEKETFVLAED